MGNDAKKQANNQKKQNLDYTNQMVNQSRTPSATENQLDQFSQCQIGNYNKAVGQNMNDYTGMMGNFNQLYSQLAARQPTMFTATRPGELNEAYGNLRSAGKGFQEFADTGGYSDKDQQELRARGISPIRAAYGNATRELDRSRALGGNGGSANYIAAASKMQRELPGQLADATTNVNAGLADAIRQGKLAGLGGLNSVGGAMGQLSSEEANRILQAQGMTEDSYQHGIGNRLGALNGMGNLYGTTPGMSSMFGNQVGNSFGQRLGAENNRFTNGLNAITSSMNQMKDPYFNQKSWLQKGLGFAGKLAPYASMVFGGPAGIAAGVGKSMFGGKGTGAPL